jgi:hypothetical protein
MFETVYDPIAVNILAWTVFVVIVILVVIALEEM